MNTQNTITCQDDIPADNTELHSIDKFTFEDFYIDSYISSGKKSESYLKACQATGYDEPNNLRQSAWSFHKRLEKAGLIEKALLDATLMDRIESRLKLRSLLNAESEAVQFQSAKHLSGSLYTKTEDNQSNIEVHINRDNVQITHKNQTLTIEDK